MKTVLLLVTTLCCIASLEAQPPTKFGRLLHRGYAEVTDDAENLVLISFTDKPSRPISWSPVSQRALARRSKVLPADRLIDERDFQLDRVYVAAVGRNVIRIRHELKWFNAVSAVATKRQIDALSRLPFVRQIEFVGRWRTRPGDEAPQALLKGSSVQAPAGTASFNYGTSYAQVNQIKVPQVHNLGITGQGIVVGVFDNGFRLLTHEAFAAMSIIAQHDFVDHKTSVIPVNPNTSFGSHGVNTLSTIGGFKSGQLIGPAFNADYILARTENDSSETPVEEDNWAAAIQWADSIGVDVTSTSLGYLTYDAPFPSWTWADMDGNTTLITQAADQAVGLGIVVVNSAGNAGAGDGIHNTLGGPADGDSVIAAGAVDAAGSRTSFSSVGPTTDVPARIKPDVMAMGSGVKVASSISTTGYGSASGTSFSCPLTAGVAALVLCANPALTPMQVRDAMRTTASNAGAPNNLIGWGILNCDSAIKVGGLMPLGTISGTAFTDINGNGVRDGGEPVVSGEKILLTGAATDSTLTDGSGAYTFDSLAIGSYSVRSSLPAGYVGTLPADSHAVSLLHAADTTGIDFGRFELAALSGTVYHDLDGDGTRDSLDAGIAGWTITFSGPAGGSTTTDSAGHFAIPNLPPGTYAVAESSMAGWFQAYPANQAPHQVSVTSGLDTSDLDFGEYYAPDIAFAVENGWNLLSLAPAMTVHGKDSLYPTSSSDAYVYAGTYQTSDTIENGIGYWLKFGVSQNVLLAGLPRTIDTVDVRQGWNMIGSLSIPVPVAAVSSIPGGLVSTPFFGYQGAYDAADTLKPGRGYFVKAFQAGQLVLSPSPVMPPSSRLRIVPTSDRPPLPPGSVQEQLPTAYALGQNYPNPFNPSTSIAFEVPAAGRVTLRVYNLLGMEVATLVDGMQDPGRKSVVFDGSGLASGVYYYRLAAGGFTEVRRMALIR